MLDKRLKAAADYVRKGAACVDIGTDHGYLAVHLVKSEITDRVIACDVNEKPLRAAEKTVTQSGLTDKIKLVLSDGLEKIDSEDAEDIIICGMGGELIISIILSSEFTRNCDKRFILQPMTYVPYLRNTLYENGFEILSETPIKDKKHVYTVIHAAYCGLFDNTTELFSIVGKIPQSGDLAAANAYLKQQYLRQKKIAEGLARSADKSTEAAEMFNLVDEIKSLIDLQNGELI